MRPVRLRQCSVHMSSMWSTRNQSHGTLLSSCGLCPARESRGRGWNRYFLSFFFTALSQAELVSFLTATLFVESCCAGLGGQRPSRECGSQPLPVFIERGTPYFHPSTMKTWLSLPNLSGQRLQMRRPRATHPQAAPLTLRTSISSVLQSVHESDKAGWAIFLQLRVCPTLANVRCT